MRLVMLVLNDMTCDSRVVREASALGEAGHDVTVLALRREGLPSAEAGDCFRIERVAEPTTASMRQPLRKLQQARRRTADFAAAVRRLAPEAVHCHDADALVIGFPAARRLGAKVVYDAGELYADMLVANREHVSPLVLSYWNRAEHSLVPSVDEFITVGEAVADEMERRFGRRPMPLLNVPDLLPLLPRDALRRELGLPPESVVVLYQGRVGYGRGLPSFVRAVARVPEVVFLIQGQGDYGDAMLALSAELGIAERVRYLGVAPISRLHEFACGADIGEVVADNLSLNNYLATPNKLFQYMMAGLPVLGSDFPGMSTVIEGEEIGLTCDVADIDSIEVALRRLAQDGPRRERFGSRARRLAETRYNWDVEKRKLLDVYEHLEAARR